MRGAHASAGGWLSGSAGAAGLLLAAAGLAPASASAQPAALVRDIATSGVNAPPIFLFGTEVVELDGALYFFADDGVHGRELWRSDGTEAGTWMVRDLCPGQCTGALWPTLRVHRGELWFLAEDGVHGREPWRSDGTSAGTRMVADVSPGSADSTPRWFTPLGDELLFTAADGDGRELWKTDGTAAGTVQVADVHPTGSSNPASFVVWRGAAWFYADDGTHGRELWTTDGTAGGTRMVRDVNPGPGAAVRPDQSRLVRFSSAAPLGDRLLFPADDGASGRELWVTDGTESGTVRLVDIEPGTEGSAPRELTAFGGEVFFQATQAATGRELWKSDGTAAGTELVRDIEPTGFGSSPQALTVAGGRLYFTAFTEAAGRELWVTDGSAAGTPQVEDLLPGSEGALTWNFVFGLEPFGERLLVQADDGVHGSEPWVSDGTPEGTFRLGDVNPGDGWAFGLFSAPLLAGTLEDRALFFAFDPAVGWELHATGGEPGDVTRVRDVDAQASSIPAATFLFRLTEMVDAGGTLFFRAVEPDHGMELWASDGTEEGTRLVRDLEPGPVDGRPGWLAPLEDRVLFQGPGDDDARWLWASDGTEAGTAPITGADAGTGAFPVDPAGLTPFDGAVYFGARDGEGERRLWRSDGTPGGTHPFPEGSPLPSPPELAAGFGRLFVATGSELWATAGTAATTEKLADVAGRDLAPAGPLLFFSGDDGASGPELWVSDGTPAGTGRVLDLLPGAEGAVPPRAGFALPFPDGPGIAGVDSPPSAFFVADDGVHGPELWWSDGTETGTRPLGDLRPGPLGSEPRYLTVIGSTAYFVADDGTHGAELWRSDGTEAGTFLLADLEPGPGASLPDSLTAVYGELFFSAWRAGDGRELWRSDGTAEGAVRIQDLHPGEGSSSPAYFTTSGDRLFFTASDGERGFELWALDAVGPRLEGTKEVAGGDLRAGGRVTYVVTLHNPGDFDLADNPGDELVDELPEGLAVTAATADAGSVTVDTGSRTVRWNGAVPAGATVTITLEAAIALDRAGAALANQARLAYDGDGSGDNETLALTDDPAAAGAADPTRFVVDRALVVEIPALSPAGLALLAVLLAMAGWLAFRTP